MNYQIIIAAVAAAAPAFAWLWSQYSSRNKSIELHLTKVDTALHNVEDRVLIVETNMKRQEPTIDEIRLKQQADAIRLAATEAAIAGIRESVRSIDDRHHEISKKLDEIPSLTAALANLSEIAKAIVPRAEIDARFDAIDGRLDAVVVSVREMRKVEAK